MELDRLWNRPEAVQAPNGSNPILSTPQPPPSPPPPPHPGLGAAILNGLKHSGEQPKRNPELERKPVTPEIRHYAELWIRQNTDAGYAQFKEHHTEAGFDKSWFDAIHRKIHSESLPPPQKEIEQVPTKTAQPKKNQGGKAFNGDAAKVREYLSTLSLSKLEAINLKEYLKESGHKLGNSATFYTAKKNVLNPNSAKSHKVKKSHHKIKNSESAFVSIGNPQSNGHVTAKPGTLFVTLAELPIADFKCTSADLRAIAERLVKAIHPRGAEAKIYVLSDPAVLEVRVPYQ